MVKFLHTNYKEWSQLTLRNRCLQHWCRRMVTVKLHFILQLKTTRYGIYILAHTLHKDLHRYYFYNIALSWLSSILKTLQERIEERESHPGAEQNREKNAWEDFWNEMGPDLLIYACEYGTVDAVKLLLGMNCPLCYTRCGVKICDIQYTTYLSIYFHVWMKYGWNDLTFCCCKEWQSWYTGVLVFTIWSFKTGADIQSKSHTMSIIHIV